MAILHVTLNYYFIYNISIVFPVFNPKFFLMSSSRFLPLMHTGISGIQSNEFWQVLDIDPDRSYPRLHENEAKVLTIYLPFVAGDAL